MPEGVDISGARVAKGDRAHDFIVLLWRPWHVDPLSRCQRARFRRGRGVRCV